MLQRWLPLTGTEGSPVWAGLVYGGEWPSLCPPGSFGSIRMMLISLSSQVTHLLIKRPPLFNYRPGDYLYLNIPTIARYEWHPFTISSAPERRGKPTPPLFRHVLSSSVCQARAGDQAHGGKQDHSCKVDLQNLPLKQGGRQANTY